MDHRKNKRILASAITCALGLLALPTYTIAENWTGEIDGSFSTTQNWQGGVYKDLNFSGDNLLGNATTTVNNDLSGKTYTSVSFNQNSTLVSDFSLTGSVLDLVSYWSFPDQKTINPYIKSFAGTNSITNDIQVVDAYTPLNVSVSGGSSLSLNSVQVADQLTLSATDAGSGLTVANIQAGTLQVGSSSGASTSLGTIQADTLSFYAGGAGSSLSLNDTITLTGGKYYTEYGYYSDPDYRTPNLSLNAGDGASLVVNGDIIDSPGPGAVIGSSRFVSISGTGVEFNGNMDIYAGGTLSGLLDIVGSTINGSIAAGSVYSDSAIIDGLIQAVSFNTEGNTTLTGTIELADQLNTLVRVVDGGNLMLSGAGAITATSVDPTATETISVYSSTLTLDNSGQAQSNRITDGATVYLGTNSSLILDGHATTAVNEQVGILEIGGKYNQSNFTTRDVVDSYNGVQNNTAYGSATLQLDSNTALTVSDLTIVQGRWLDVVPVSGTLGGGAASDSALYISSSPTLNNGLLDGVLINRQEFATYDVINGVISATSDDNVRLDTVTSLPVTGSSQVMNSLALNFDGVLGGTDAVQLTSGQLLANGNITIAPSIDFGAQQGRLYAFGDVDFAGGAIANNGLQVSGDQEFDSTYYGTTLNTRTVTFSGGVTLNGALGIDSATVQLSNTQTANLTGGVLNNAVLDNAGTIVNTGHLELWGYYNNRVNNSGSFTNDGGTFGYISGVSTISGSTYFANTGSLVNQATGTIRSATLFNDGGDFLNDHATFYGSVQNTSGGVVTNQNGGEIIAGLSNNNATATNDASWINYNGGFSNSNGGVIVNNGYMEGNYSSYDWLYASDFTVDATSSLQNNGEINLIGGNLVLASGAQYSGGGVVRLSEICGWYGGGDVCVGGSLIAQDTNFTFTGTLYGDAGFTRNGGTIHGDASLTYNSGSVYGSVSALSANFTNTGTIDGQVSGSTITNNGTLNLTQAGSNIGTLINNHTASFSEAVSISALQNNGTFNNYVNLSLNSVTNKGTFNNNVNQSFTTLTNTDVATFNNNANLTIATLKNGATGTIVNKAGGNSIAIGGGVNEGTITNQANSNVSVSGRNEGTITNEADANLSVSGFKNNGTINNTGGTVTVSSWLNNTGSITNSGTIDNAGSITNSGTLNNTASIINNGAVNITDTGSITGTGTYVQNAGSTRINGNLTASAVTINGGSVYGSGTIDSSLTISDGLLGPGNSPGALEVTGNFVLTEAGTLHMEIGSDGLDPAGYLYDQLIVGGDYDLQGGLLKFSLLDGIDIFDLESDFTIGDFFRSGTADSNIGFDLLQLAMFDNLDLYAYDVLGDSWFTLALDETGAFIATASTSPVPVPAAVWLFGSGLIGLIGVARRKAA